MNELPPIPDNIFGSAASTDDIFSSNSRPRFESSNALPASLPTPRSAPESDAGMLNDYQNGKNGGSNDRVPNMTIAESSSRAYRSTEDFHAVNGPISSAVSKSSHARSLSATSTPRVFIPPRGVQEAQNIAAFVGNFHGKTNHRPESNAKDDNSSLEVVEILKSLKSSVQKLTEEEIKSQSKLVALESIFRKNIYNSTPTLETSIDQPELLKAVLISQPIMFLASLVFGVAVFWLVRHALLLLFLADKSSFLFGNVIQSWSWPFLGCITSLLLWLIVYSASSSLVWFLDKYDDRYECLSHFRDIVVCLVYGVGIAMLLLLFWSVFGAVGSVGGTRTISNESPDNYVSELQIRAIHENINTITSQYTEVLSSMSQIRDNVFSIHNMSKEVISLNEKLFRECKISMKMNHGDGVKTQDETDAEIIEMRRKEAHFKLSQVEQQLEIGKLQIAREKEEMKQRLLEQKFLHISIRTSLNQEIADALTHYDTCSIGLFGIWEGLAHSRIGSYVPSLPWNHSCQFWSDRVRFLSSVLKKDSNEDVQCNHVSIELEEENGDDIVSDGGEDLVHDEL